MAKPSGIDGVREDPVDVASRDQAAARRLARCNNPNWQSNVFGIENGLEPHHAAAFEVASEEHANEVGVLFNDMKSTVLHPLSERDCATHPNASLFRSSDFVADALPGNLALELRKRQQHVEG